MTDMGIYDFFRGKCPNCNGEVDDHPQYGKCGDIQTKYFIREYDDGFRDFYPGQRVPFAPGRNLVIGRTCCCNTIIKAVFNDDRLMEYNVVIGKEKRDYLKNEIGSVFSRWMPDLDRYWYDHRSNWDHLGMEESIIRTAMHPSKINFYLENGYSIEEICDA